jgi:hypothetical protein
MIAEIIIVLAVTVAPVADDRVAEVRKMPSDLMPPPGQGPNIDAGIPGCGVSAYIPRAF